MTALSFIHGAARATQFLAGALVVCLAVWLHHDWTRARHSCDVPLRETDRYSCRHFAGLWLPPIEFAAFVGAWGVLDALAGVGAFFVDVGARVAHGAAALDALAVIFGLAAGIKFAVMFDIHGGFIQIWSRQDMYHYIDARVQVLALTVFAFIGFAAAAVALGLQYKVRQEARGGRIEL